MASKSCFIEYIEYLPIRATSWFIQLLPYHFSLKLGRGLGLVLYYILPQIRQITFKGLNIAFGDSYSQERITEIARKCFKHFGMVFMEFIQLPKLQRQNRIQSSHKLLDIRNRFFRNVHQIAILKIEILIVDAGLQHLLHI